MRTEQEPQLVEKAGPSAPTNQVVGEVRAEQSTTGVAILDCECRVLFANETIRQWLGDNLGLLISQERLADILSSGQPAEWQAAFGELDLQISASPFLNGGNEPQVVVTAFNSAPLQKLQRRFAELQAAAADLDALFQNSYDAMYIVDQHGITLNTNDAIQRLTGIPKEYYIGKDMRYLEKRGVVQKSVSFEVMKQKKPVTVIQENSLGKVILITGSPVFDDQGEVARVVTNLRDISELNQLRQELSQLRKFHVGEEPVIVASKSMERVLELTRRVASTDTTILLLGESGVGKEVVARMIHRNSGRYEKGAFIKVNCGAIPQELLESELFGYESGAFTGAKKEGKLGMFELAHRGTIFLDEIGELPLHLQVKLLRVLQDQEFHRVGGTKPVKVDVRILAATNRDLQKMVAQGTFREDLYYRLYVVPIEIPPLRKRREDILPLISFYLDKFNRKYQTDTTLTEETLQILQQYDWPGNIRELANLIERLLVITPSQRIEPKHLPYLTGVRTTDAGFASNFTPGADSSGTDFSSGADFTPGTYSSGADAKSEAEMGLQQTLEKFEHKLLENAYSKYGSSYEVAKALKISQSTAIRKAYKYGIRIKSEEV